MQKGPQGCLMRHVLCYRIDAASASVCAGLWRAESARHLDSDGQKAGKTGALEATRHVICLISE